MGKKVRCISSVGPFVAGDIYEVEGTNGNYYNFNIPNGRGWGAYRFIDVDSESVAEKLPYNETGSIGVCPCCFVKLGESHMWCCDECWQQHRSAFFTTDGFEDYKNTTVGRRWFYELGLKQRGQVMKTAKIAQPTVDATEQAVYNFFTSVRPGHCKCDCPKRQCWIHKDL